MRPTLFQTLRVLLWNAYVGNAPAEVIQKLNALALAHLPEVIVLNEATRVQGDLVLEHYRTFHEANPPRRRSKLRPEAADTAVLVRKDITVRKHRVKRMTRTWLVLRYRKRHEPRLYHLLWLEKNGQVWKVGAGHLPTGGMRSRSNGPAVRESVAFIRSWMRVARTRRPSLFIADMNLTEDELPIPSEGHSIDRVAHNRNCTVTARKLAKYGSDHNAVLFDARTV